MDALRKMFQMIAKGFAEIGFLDVLDIILVTLLFYWVIHFIRQRRAGKLTIGIAVLIGFQLLGSFLGLQAISFILQNFFQIGLLALLVIFQPEIRDALERMGALRNVISHVDPKDVAVLKNTVKCVCEAACDMSADQTGALIVLERTTGLEEFVCSGTLINAEVSKPLLKNIFFNRAPLHDGAVVIRNNQIHSAGCKLPLATNVVGKDFGTRHRAAIGMSALSDAAVVVVSEETGTISLAFNGELKRGYDYTRLYNELYDLMNRRQITDIVVQKMTLRQRWSSLVQRLGGGSDGSEEES